MPYEYLLDIHITIDPYNGLYRAKDLDYFEQEYLKHHKYKTGFFVPIGKTRQEEFYIKPAPPESPSHTFLVLSIRDELQCHTPDVKISKTKEPDIIFTNSKGETIALEIETGKGFNKHKRRLRQKFETLRQRYKKRIHIIITDCNQKRKYHHLAPAVRIMTRKDLPAFIKAQFPRQ
jgi:hypothetical protein